MIASRVILRSDPNVTCVIIDGRRRRTRYLKTIKVGNKVTICCLWSVQHDRDMMPFIIAEWRRQIGFAPTILVIVPTSEIERSRLQIEIQSTGASAFLI